MSDRSPPKPPLIYRFLRDASGQSETVGIVLLLGIVVVGSVAVISFGSTALNETRDAMYTRSAEHTMTQLDAKIAEVALGDSEAMTAELPPTGPNRGVEVVESGWIKVEVLNASTGAVEDTVLNRTMGAIVYRSGGTEIAYQGGGVWRRQGNGSTMVSPPEFHYRDETLTLPVVLVRGNAAAGGTLSVSRAGRVNRTYPNATRGFSNPLVNGEVNITVHSEYYEAWGQFFEQRTQGLPTYDHQNETVTVTLVVELEEDPTVNAGVVSGGTGTTLAVDKTMVADSYNSSSGDYAATNGDNTSIVAEGSIQMDKSAIIKGSLEAGGDVTMKKDTLITGNLRYGGVLDDSSSNTTVKGYIAANGSVTSPSSAGSIIDEKDQLYDDSNNDNDVESAVDNSTKTLDTSCFSPCEIDPGDYWLSSLTVPSGETLKFNTTGGPINIYVDGKFLIESNANVEVTNKSNPVRIYVDRTSGPRDLEIGSDATIEVEADRSPALWIYMSPGSSTRLDQDVHFEGVIYGPGTSTTSGTVFNVRRDVSIFGGIVGEVDTMKKDVDLHYDESLANATAFDAGADHYVPTVTYLHITVNRVNVSD